MTLLPAFRFDDPGATPTPPAGPAATGWLLARGATGRAIAAHPWQDSAWGALETWPAHLRSFVNFLLGSDAPMALVWGREMRVLYNDRYAEIIQDKHPSALGARAADIFPEMWSVLQPITARVLAGEPCQLEDVELPLTRRGATAPAYFSFSYNPVRGPGGEVEGFLAVVSESTARVLRERERAEVFDTVLSSIADFAYVFDRNCRFIFANRALLNLWGLPLDQVLGKSFADLKYPEELSARLRTQIAQVIAEKKSVRDEVRYVSPTGVDGWYEHIFSPVLGPDGEVRLVAGSSRDITKQRKLTHDALAASKAKDAFLATLSHELRTPLNPVLLIATDGANNPAWPEPARADFRTIVENVVMEARLIDDLLDISRITHDKLPLRFRTVDLHAVLTRAVTATQPDAAAKGLSLAVELAAPAAFVPGDEVRLHQIFSNLLRNAVKFTGPGGRVTLATRTHPARRDALLVEVADTGIGLTLEEAANVFQPFAQGEHAASSGSPFGGLGLGLTIAKKLAELHSGAITAGSAGRGQGSTFIVELPLAPGAPAAPGTADPASDPASAPDRARHRRMRVLLVEDHAASRSTLARLLAARNIAVVPAASAEEALHLAETHPVDYVISDIGLPNLDGYDLMRALRAKFGYRGLALSGYGTERDIERGREAGFSLYLTKPVQSQALYDALDYFAMTLD